MNYFKISRTMPFQFIKNGLDSIHPDEMWAFEHIRSHQIKVDYKQKWKRGTKTFIQCESTIAPNNLQVKNKYGATVKTFTWLVAIDAGTYKVYYFEFDIDDLPDDYYFLYQVITAGALTWKLITEPIALANSWENTLLFEYKNSFDRDDVFWFPTMVCRFFCEADIQDYEPDTERNNYLNQIKSTTLLDSFPGEAYQLYIGDTRYGRSGVTDYIIKKLDRIFCCDTVLINDKQYAAKTGSNFKITRNRNYPLIGASLDIVPSVNESSTQFADTTPVFDFGIITAYNIETDFFGDDAIVPVLEVEENG